MDNDLSSKKCKKLTISMTKANLFKVGQNLKVTDCILAHLHFSLVYY